MSELYIVPTPIGNLGDITVRALETLRDVGFIAAEDTRVTSKLLAHYEIRKPLLCCFEHNELSRGREIVARILSGESCALVTDAGTPAISDPGEVLVRECVEAGITVVPLPGPCAAITALSACGLPTGQFCFEGFLPTNHRQRRERLSFLSGETRTIVFYEAPHKLCYTLSDLLAAFGDRRVSLGRELTKLHEEFIRTTLSGAAELYSGELAPKGEYVLVVEGAERAKAEPVSLDSLDLSKRPKDVVADAKRLGVSRNEAYRAALKAKETKEAEDE